MNLIISIFVSLSLFLQLAFSLVLPSSLQLNQTQLDELSNASPIIILFKKDNPTETLNATYLDQVLDPKFKASLLTKMETEQISSVSTRLFGPNREENKDKYYQNKFLLTQASNVIDRFIDCYSQIKKNISAQAETSLATQSSAPLENRTISESASASDPSPTTPSNLLSNNTCLFSLPDNSSKNLAKIFTQLATTFKKMKSGKGMCLGEDFGMCSGEKVEKEDIKQVDLIAQSSDSAPPTDTTSPEYKKNLLSELESKSKLLASYIQSQPSLKQSIELSLWINIISSSITGAS
ncbi:hypothetical protein BB560_001034 [Smittium megazygosporum]|uniref:Uncharacterized protein n=1 Tax=Smittium megazygosporum TaxID=133381 RepID=A0A2T9ZIY1_9FUNG|nr:hypothetical protein BB560_001034 [Smittium megazygosporum]